MDLTKMNSLDVVLIAGLPGSGKSQFAKANFQSSERQRINRKEIRKTMYEMTHFGDLWKESYFNDHDELLVKHVEKKIFEHILQTNKKVLIDNISVTKNSRKNYINIASQMKKSIGIIFLNTPVKECIRRNRIASDHLPEIVISKLFASIEMPQIDEGFKEVIILNENQ